MYVNVELTDVFLIKSNLFTYLIKAGSVVLADVSESLSAVVCFSFAENIIFTSLLGSDQTASSPRRIPVLPLIYVWMMIPTSWGRSRSRRADCRGESTGPTGPLWAECWVLPS